MIVFLLQRISMKIDPSKHYRMPIHLGPIFGYDDLPKWSYPDIDIVAYQYLTQAEAIEALLPECYQPGKEPMVTAFFSQYNGLNFMAGAGYRTATFQVAARFDGEVDHLEGDFILVMFEDKTWPIIGGREDLGIPKLHADISSFRILSDGRIRVEASMWGHLLFSLDVPRLRSQAGVVRVLASRRINARPWLGYKYIPSLGGPPDAEYPTITKNDIKLDKLWLGKTATIRFGDAEEADIGEVRNLLSCLSTLTVVKPIQALRFRGSAILRYDLSRKLL
jgi:acetoacetate decarboxylase